MRYLKGRSGDVKSTGGEPGGIEIIERLTNLEERSSRIEERLNLTATCKD